MRVKRVGAVSETVEASRAPVLVEGRHAERATRVGRQRRNRRYGAFAVPVARRTGNPTASAPPRAPFAAAMATTLRAVAEAARQFFRRADAVHFFSRGGDRACLYRG